MSTATTTRHPLARRGAAYTQMLKDLERRGATALHQDERGQIIDCADALLFDEPEADAKRTQVGELLSTLAESGRWTAEATEEFGLLLDQISA